MEPPHSILVIDDEDSICLAFEQFFSRRQWKVYLAATAAEGLELCKQAAANVVFLDVRLPIAAAWTCCRSLRPSARA